MNIQIRNENPTVTGITGDFNAMLPVFWEGGAKTRDGVPSLDPHSKHNIIYGQSLPQVRQAW